MHSSQPRSNAERAATAESAAAYQKYVVQPAVAPVKNKVHDTKETVQVAAAWAAQFLRLVVSRVWGVGRVVSRS
jgi:hypothetical protein